MINVYAWKCKQNLVQQVKTNFIIYWEDSNKLMLKNINVLKQNFCACTSLILVFNLENLNFII